MYLGSMLVGDETLIQVVSYGPTVRYISLETTGRYHIVDDTPAGAGNIHIRAMRHLLDSIPPDTTACFVHGDARWLRAWCQCLEATELMKDY